MSKALIHAVTMDGDPITLAVSAIAAVTDIRGKIIRVHFIGGGEVDVKEAKGGAGYEGFIGWMDE